MTFPPASAALEPKARRAAEDRRGVFGARGPERVCLLSYSITGVPAGNQTCTASKAGYVSKTQTASVPSGGTATANFALRTAKSGGGKGKGEPPR